MASNSKECSTLLQNTSTNFALSFGQPFNDNYTPEQFLALFHPSVEWVDHAFHIRRVGHDAILGLRKAFLHCNQPFRSDIKAILHTSEGAVVETLWVGRCTNDIVRPNGDVAVKGTGKDFRTHICMLLKINDEGRITRIDEYYSKLWDAGVEEKEYTVVQGVYSKD